MVSEGNTAILIDPLLNDSFGSGFEIYPPRKIMLDMMPTVDAIFLSHEHSDHFNIPSLCKLPRHTKVYVNILMSSAVTKVLSECGFDVIRFDFNTPIEIGALEILGFPAGVETVFWESRVTQLKISSIKTKKSFYLAIDSLISEDFVEQAYELDDIPDLFAVSNNSQIAPHGMPGSLDNCLIDDSNNQSKRGFIGVYILQDILINYSELLGEMPNIAICGGGFMKRQDTCGPFHFSDQEELGVIASALCPETNIYGVTPGDKISIAEDGMEKSSADWIKLDEKRKVTLIERRRKFLEENIPVKLKAVSSFHKPQKKLEDSIQYVYSSLNKMAQAIMLSKMGQTASKLIKHNNEPIDDHRILFSFIVDDHSPMINFVLNFHAGVFEKIDSGESYADQHYPFGIRFFLQDFVSVLAGSLQIWDLAGVSVKSWYVGSPFDSPITFLYSYLGENIQTDLAYKAYGKTLNHMKEQKII